MEETRLKDFSDSMMGISCATLIIGGLMSMFGMEKEVTKSDILKGVADLIIKEYETKIDKLEITVAEKVAENNKLKEDLADLELQIDMLNDKKKKVKK